MRNRKILAMVGVSAMMIGLVACGSKAESNITESATPAPTAEATPTPEPTEEPAESHDFDSSVNKYKTEINMDIKQYSGDSVSDTADCDDGTDIPDTSILYDWLYTNGVTRESVQNDRDSGCKNPYLEGYLEYLDNLDKPSETPSNTEIDFSKADAVHDSSEFGGNAGGKVYEINGHYYLEDGLELAKDADGNWAVLVPDLGVADSITKEEIDESTQKVVDAFNDPEYIKYAQELVEKYGG
ncbi:MAG: hypothetical protein PUF25_02470 [Gemmiger formicilis]|uniref:hypothetical protein n=1 Tax=Gemmiger formicilis TaxID=745368 RepID=UPI003FF0BF08|nr:hypothetical protein [Gemmiger formicilis]